MVVPKRPAAKLPPPGFPAHQLTIEVLRLLHKFIQDGTLVKNSELSLTLVVVLERPPPRITL